MEDLVRAYGHTPQVPTKLKEQFAQGKELQERILMNLGSLTNTIDRE